MAVWTMAVWKPCLCLCCNQVSSNRYTLFSSPCAAGKAASKGSCTFGFVLQTMKTRPLLLTTRQASQIFFTADRTLIAGPD